MKNKTSKKVKISKIEERTLVLMKPDAVKRGIVGEVLTRFERAGLKLVGCKMVFPSEAHYHHHYEHIGKIISRRGEKTFDVLLSFMRGGPILALVLEGVDAVSLVRKMVGPTEPKTAPPGTIRGDYAHVSFAHADREGLAIPNVVHASGNIEEAREEVTHWFSETELFSYESAHESFTIPRRKH